MNMPFSDDLKLKIMDVGRQLSKKQEFRNNLSKGRIRDLITAQVGEFTSLKRLDHEQLNTAFNQASVTAVDGSINEIGSEYPHYLALLQAIALDSRSRERILLGDVHTPMLMKLDTELLDGRPPALADIQFRRSKLAAMEVQVALEAIEQFSPRLILMDGPLIRYRIECGDVWDGLLKSAIDKHVLIVGVIEEIATHGISEILADQLPVPMQDLYDRAILFGVIDPGEMLEVKSKNIKKGLRTCFLRLTRDPQVIGLDIPEEQIAHTQLIADFLYTFTPEGGRGIPFLLDMADREVRITDALMDGILDAYIDSGIRRWLFSPKRGNRNY